MRIGIDIDNVIADLDKTFLEEFEKEDKNKRNKGIINEKENSSDRRRGGRHVCSTECGRTRVRSPSV